MKGQSEQGIALREALRETTAVVHSLGWHNQRGWTAETCPIERCRRNRILLARAPVRPEEPPE